MLSYGFVGNHVPLRARIRTWNCSTERRKSKRKGIEKAFPLYQLRWGSGWGPHKTTDKTSGSLLHNGGFCNGCITKRILILHPLLYFLWMVDLLRELKADFGLQIALCQSTNDNFRHRPNGFFYLSIHNKTNIMQIMTKKYYSFYLFNLLSQINCEIRSFYETFLELCKHRFVTQLLQNPPFCSMQHHIFRIPYIIDLKRSYTKSYTFFCKYESFRDNFAKMIVLAKTFMFTLVNGLSTVQPIEMAKVAGLDVYKWGEMGH